MTDENPTPWQRLLRSPWTYLALMLMALDGVAYDRGWWLVLNSALFIYWGCVFYEKACKRWGRP